MIPGEIVPASGDIELNLGRKTLRVSVANTGDRPMFGAFGGAREATRMTFLSQWAADDGLPAKIGLHSLVGVVRGCRDIGKSDMVHNAYRPRIEVDPQTYEVRADGQLLTCEPAEVLPMAQRYFLF